MAKKFSISVVLDAENRLGGVLNKVGKSLEKFGKKAREIGKKMTATLTLPIVAFGALALRSAVSFQAAMNMVGAVTNATAKEFKEMTELAKELGATTQFSATQAAEGLKFLGMAGLSVKESMEALPSALH